MPNYDEDHNDPKQHCEHGTFIGSWWGPDYLCQWCENGTSRADFEAEMEARRREHLVTTALATVFDAAYDAALTFVQVPAMRDGVADFFIQIRTEVQEASTEVLEEFLAAA